MSGLHDSFCRTKARVQLFLLLGEVLALAGSIGILSESRIIRKLSGFRAQLLRVSQRVHFGKDITPRSGGIAEVPFCCPENRLRLTPIPKSLQSHIRALSISNGGAAYDNP
jgi:hypothetical protein